MKLYIAVLLGIACSLSAQTKAPSPDPKPSTFRRATSQQDNDLSTYDFNGALQKLRGQPANPKRDSPPLDPAPAQPALLPQQPTPPRLRSPLALHLIGALLTWF